jgi:hypothetical protein
MRGRPLIEVFEEAGLLDMDKADAFIEQVRAFVNAGPPQRFQKGGQGWRCDYCGELIEGDKAYQYGHAKDSKWARLEKALTEYEDLISQ